VDLCTLHVPETISLRRPAALLAELKALANKRDVPFPSLKVFLAERVDRETHGVHALSTRPHQSRKGATGHEADGCSCAPSRVKLLPIGK
jgi:hypothetical protein